MILLSWRIAVWNPSVLSLDINHRFAQILWLWTGVIDQRSELLNPFEYEIQHRCKNEADCDSAKHEWLGLSIFRLASLVERLLYAHEHGIVQNTRILWFGQLLGHRYRESHKRRTTFSEKLPLDKIDVGRSSMNSGSIELRDVVEGNNRPGEVITSFNDHSSFLGSARP